MARFMNKLIKGNNGPFMNKLIKGNNGPFMNKLLREIMARL